MAETTQKKREVFATKYELSVALAKYTADLSAKFCKEKGIFTVVLSGGGLIDWLWSISLPFRAGLGHKLIKHMLAAANY